MSKDTKRVLLAISYGMSINRLRAEFPKQKNARLPRKTKKAYKLNKLPNSGINAIKTIFIRIHYRPVKGVVWQPLLSLPWNTKPDAPHFEIPKG